MSDGQGTGSSAVYMITCVVERGKGDRVTKAALDAGAGGATAFFARGTGTRERLGLLGLAIVPEKEVIQVVCKHDIADPIFDAICKAAKLDVPGRGMAVMTPVIRAAGGSLTKSPPP